MTKSVNELYSELESIVGDNSDNGSAKKPESFKAAFDNLSKGNQEVSDEFGELAKKVTKAEKDLRKETKEAIGIEAALHPEIIRIHKEATLEEKLNIDYALIKKAFESKGNAKKTESGSVELNLDNLTEKDPKDYVRSGEYLTPVTRGEPTIFYKPLTEKRGWFNNEIETNQVEVVIVMNNGLNVTENTVVTMVVQHKGGKLIWGKGQPGLYDVKDMQEFIDDVSASENKKATSKQKLAGGDITIQEYNRLYEKENGESLTEMWNKWDKKVGEAPDDKDPHAGEKLTQKAEIDAERKEIIARLGNEYTEKLQKLQALQEKVLESVSSKLAEVKTRNESIIKNELFDTLIRLVKDDAEFHKQTIETLKRTLSKLHGIEISYLDGLIEKGTK